MVNEPPIEVPSSLHMPVTTGRSEQVAIRLPHEHIERSKAILGALTRPGLEAPSFAEVMRAIVAKGLEAWERELDIGLVPPKPGSKAASKARAKR